MASKSIFPYRSEPVQWLRLLPTVVLAVLAVIAASAVFASGRSATARASLSAPVPEASPLHLRVTSKPQQVEVHWEHDSDAIHSAEKGVMQIWDGEISEVLPFDNRQLQDGSVIYRPQTNDVTVRLAVFGHDGKTVSESVRAIAIP